MSRPLVKRRNRKRIGISLKRAIEYIFIVYLQTTSIFQDFSTNSPVTFGFSALQVIDFPWSSTPGSNSTMLTVRFSDLSSCVTDRSKLRKVCIFWTVKWSSSMARFVSRVIRVSNDRKLREGALTVSTITRRTRCPSFSSKSFWTVEEDETSSRCRVSCILGRISCSSGV